MCVCLGWGDREAHAKASVSLSGAHRNWKEVFIKKERKKKRPTNHLSGFCLCTWTLCFVVPRCFSSFIFNHWGQKPFEQITGFFSLILAWIQATAPHAVDLSPLGSSGIDLAKHKKLDQCHKGRKKKRPKKRIKTMRQYNTCRCLPCRFCETR